MRLLITILLAVASFVPSASYGQTMWNVTAERGFKENGLDVFVGNVRATKDGAVITCERAESFGDIVKLLGNVVLTKEGTRMYATDMTINKATDIAEVRTTNGYVKIIGKDGTVLKSPFVNYKLKDEIFYFFNGGVIESDGSTMEGETGTYYEKAGVAYVKNNVQVHNKEYLAIADSARYNKNEQLATVLGKIVFWHKDGVLKANKGTYHEPTKTFRLFENSYALSKENQAWADSIVYNKEKELLYLGRNICILDTANHGALLGDYGFADSNREYTFMTKSAAAAMFRPKEDTLFLRADTLMAYNLRNRSSIEKDSLIRFVKALDRVRFYREDLQGKCDSLVYNTLDSVAYMYGVPIIWNEQNQISADSITIFTKNQKVDRAELVLNSFIVQKETEKYFNQIKGRSMTAFFSDDNKISKVDVKGNGQTIYFVKDSTSIEGVNKASSSNISVNMEDGQVASMVFKVKPESVLYPLEKIEESDLLLKGFRWSPDNRPLNRFEVTKKIVRKSIAPEVEAIPRPQFPIFQRINGKNLDTTIGVKN